MTGDIDDRAQEDTAGPWQSVASVEEAAAIRGWLPVDVGGSAIVLRRVDGTWYAVADSCSHAGCAFSEDAELHGTTIVCNCHGSEFDLRTGVVVRGPAEYDVRTYEVRERDGRLELRR